MNKKKRRYKCAVCGRFFSTDETLKKHYKDDHKIGMPFRRYNL